MIKQVKEKPTASSKLKRDHYAQIGVMEVFLEATPTVYVYLILIVRILNTGPFGDYSNGLRQLIFADGSSFQITVFFLSFGTSIFSSAFGVAR